MTETDIKILLERFYDGNTTLEEEKVLYQYFLYNDNICPELTPDKDLFLSLNKLNESDPPEEFEKNIESFIDKLGNPAPKTGIIRFVSWKKISGIAAAVAILIASGISYTNYDAKQKDAIYIPSPEKNYQEAERALVLLSQNLNKGASKVDIAEKKVDKVSEILNKQFQ